MRRMADYTDIERLEARINELLKRIEALENPSTDEENQLTDEEKEDDSNA